MKSHLEDLSVSELIGLTFLVEEGRPALTLGKELQNGKFREKWRETEARYRKLIRFYPNEDEEKHYLIANLEAVYGIDPYAEDTMRLVAELQPVIQKLFQGG